MTPLIYAQGGSLTGQSASGPVSLTGGGAIRSRPFDGVTAWLVEEATTNYVANPGFEANVTPWLASGATIARDTAQASSGVASLRVDRASGSGSAFTRANSGTYNAGETYIASGRAKAAAGAQWLQIIAWYTAGSGGGNSGYKSGTTIAATGGWVSLPPISVAIAAGKVSQQIDFALFPDSVAGAAQAWLDSAQLEQKDHVTSSCPELDGSGNPQPGYTWTGTAHNSPSTRAAASLAIPVAAFPGALYVRFSEDGGATVQSAVLTTPGAIGTYGVAAWASGTLTITSTRALSLGKVLGYPSLSPDQIATLDATPTALLGWDTLVEVVIPGGVVRAAAPDPVMLLRQGAPEVGVLRAGSPDPAGVLRATAPDPVATVRGGV